eukprot:g12112.t1
MFTDDLRGAREDMLLGERDHGGILASPGPEAQSAAQPATSSAAEPIRRAVLRWRLSRGYVIYCFVIFALSGYLLYAHVADMIQVAAATDKSAPPASEVLAMDKEVLLVEILLTLLLTAEFATSVGLRRCRGGVSSVSSLSFWLKLDLAVIVLGWTSLCAYFLFRMRSGSAPDGGGGGEQEEQTKEEQAELLELAELPFLVARFVLQPLRIASQLAQLRERLGASRPGMGRLGAGGGFWSVGQGLADDSLVDFTQLEDETMVTPPAGMGVDQ